MEFAVTCISAVAFESSALLCDLGTVNGRQGYSKPSVKILDKRKKFFFFFPTRCLVCSQARG